MTLQRPWTVQQILLVAAVGIAVASQFYVHQEPDSIVVWALLISAAFLAAVVGRHACIDADSSAAAAPRRINMRRLIACSILAIAAVAATTSLSASYKHLALAVVLWLIALPLGAVGVYGWHVSPPRRSPWPWSLAEAMALAAVVLFGLGTRLLWLNSIPPYYFPDEARLGWGLVVGYRNPPPNFFTMGWNGWPWIAISLQGLFAPLFGASIFSLRLSSALMGTLAIVATYLLARELFSPRVAVLAALLFATCRTTIEFSRLGLCHAQVILYETAAFYCWWRGIRGGRATSYWWAGIALGMCILTYNAGDLAPLLWAGWLGLTMVLSPRSVGRYWRGAAVTAAGFLTVTFPWLRYITDHFTFGTTWEQWTIIAHNRNALTQIVEAWHNTGANAAADVLWHQAWSTWLGFGVLPGGAYPELYYRGGGMLDDVSAALFCIGLVMTIASWRSPRRGFVLYWWLATAVGGGVLTIDAPATARMVGILPALAILAALPLEALVGTVYRNGGRPLAAGLVALLLGSAVWMNCQTYFVEFANAPFADDETAVGRRIERLPSGATAFLVGSHDLMNFFYELFHFNYPGRHLQDVADPAHLLPLHQPVTLPVALIFGPTQMSLAAQALALYPHAEVTDDVSAPEHRLRFRELRLTPDDVAAQTGLHLTLYDESHAVAEKTSADPFGDKLDLPNGVARLQWNGRIYWPSDRPATLTVRANHTAEISLAGNPAIRVDATGLAETTLTLPRGWQPLSIAEPAGSGRAFSMLIQTPEGTHPVTAWDLNPASVFEGLTGLYTRDGQPVLRVIDPQLNFFAFTEEPVFAQDRQLMVALPFTASWTGALRITVAGTYTFEARGTGKYSVRLDGTTLVEGAQSAEATDDVVATAQRTLAAGLHPLEARWDCPLPRQGRRRRLQLYWTPPDAPQELIPPSGFTPAVAGAELPPGHQDPGKRN